MKKNFLIAFLAVLTVIFITGCITESGTEIEATQTPTPEMTPAEEIIIEKTGLSYNVGDILIITLPSNPTTGYDWNVTASSELNIIKTYEAPDTKLLGAGGRTVLNITADKEGLYELTFRYMRPWESEESAIYTYYGTMFVEKTADKLLSSPRCITKYFGNLNPKVGETISISTYGNPTTGYEWEVSGSNGLNISKPTFNASNTESDGAGGTYTWIVTADKAGRYVFKANYTRSFEDAPISYFDLDLLFIDKNMTEESN